MTRSAHESLRGRVVIVTGSSRGAGREFARALAQAGARITLVASRISDALRVTEQEIRALAPPDSVLTIPVDIRRPEACERIVRATIEEFGRVDCLVNNAGVGGQLRSAAHNVTPVPFWEGPVALWQQTFETNTLAPFYLARAAAPRMVAHGFGRIVGVSTSPATMTRRGYSPYGPSKAAHEMMMRIWAQDLDSTGVTANMLLPDGTDGTDGKLPPANVMNEALLWLLSDESNGVSGHRFVGNLWDTSLAPSDAARGAMQPVVALPAIL